MVKITVNKEVHDAIRAAAIGRLDDSRTRVLPNGDREIEIDEEIRDRITQLMLPGESISDTLLRAFAVLGGKVN